jgi:hypothetical protein
MDLKGFTFTYVREGDLQKKCLCCGERKGEELFFQLIRKDAPEESIHIEFKKELIGIH